MERWKCHSQEETRTWSKSEGKIRDGESQKREDAGARKGREVAKPSVFPVFCGSGGSKSRLAKAAGAGVAGQMRDEKLHAVVARSTFGSKKCQNLRFSGTRVLALSTRVPALACSALACSALACSALTPMHFSLVDMCVLI